MAHTGTGSIEFAQSEQELVSNKRRGHRSWMLLGGIVLLLVGGVILLAVLLSSGPVVDPRDEKPPLALKDFLSGRLSAERFNATWVSDTELLYRLGRTVGSHSDEKSLEADDEDDLVEGDVYLYNAGDKTRKLLISGDVSPAMQASFIHELSPDRKYLLIGFNYRKVYRHSFIANYALRSLEVGGREYPLNARGVEHIEAAVWGSRGSQIAFVLNGDLYYKPSAAAAPLRITDTGQSGLIYNGAPDWVYEEEIFASNKAIWFSPGGNFLAFASFNDTNVRSVDIPYYGPPGHPETQYPAHHIVRYPKCGTNNPVVTVRIADFRDLVPKYLDVLAPPEVGNFNKPLAEPVLATVTWLNEGSLITVWMNRVQNLALIQICQVPGNSTSEAAANCRTVHKQESKTGWIDLFKEPLVNGNGTEFAFIASFEQGSDGAYRHIAVVNALTGHVTARTKGTFTVTEILHWDKQDHIFYQATSVSDPGEQHVYSVDSEGKTHCISCEALPEQHRGRYHTATFSKDASFLSLVTGGPQPPRVDVIKKSGHHVLEWEDNSNLRKFLNDHRMPQLERMSVPIPGAEGLQAQVGLQLPPDVDRSGNTKYPVLVSVYAGPDTFQVSEKWSAEWGAYLASNRSIVYVSIDGRGSGLKGDATAHANYRNLGGAEVMDQINVTRHLLQTLPYLDAKKAAIWGWSYGGYATIAALASDTNNVFQCGMAVAPVTDWALYDSIYTERYMGLPTVQDNAIGYHKAALTTPERIEALKKKKMLLVHGSFDDNVHYQQSMRFSRALELNDIAFEEMSYADEDHSLSNVRPHLFHTLERFLNECLKPDS